MYFWLSSTILKLKFANNQRNFVIAYQFPCHFHYLQHGLVCRWCRFCYCCPSVTIVEVEQCVRSLSPAPMAACARRVQLAKREESDTSSATCVSRVYAIHALSPSLFLSLFLHVSLCVRGVCLCMCVVYRETNKKWRKYS